MKKQSVVLDTNVILTTPNILKTLENSNIFIPFSVLEELDKFKKKMDVVGMCARTFSRTLDELSQRKDLSQGVEMDNGSVLYIFEYSREEMLEYADFDYDKADNRIIAFAGLIMNEEKYRAEKFCLISMDILVRVKARSKGIPAKEHKTGQVIKSLSDLYSGFKIIHISDDELDRIYSYGIETDCFLLDSEEERMPPNCCVVAKASNSSVLLRVLEYDEEEQANVYVRVPDYKGSKHKSVFGLIPRNKEQNFSLDLLMNPEIKLVTLTGKAGTGKTLLAAASALHQVISGSKKGAEPTYEKILISRKTEGVGKDIGYLPGSKEEKMNPWLAPVYDNLDFLMNGKREHLEAYLKDGTIEIEAITYTRGRSLSNAYVLIDEAQNMTVHEIKTIITRIGENSKIILTGDIEQIDSSMLDEKSNGLTYVIEKFKNHKIAAHLTLIKGERSELATLAAEIL